MKLPVRICIIVSIALSLHLVPVQTGGTTNELRNFHPVTGFNCVHRQFVRYSRHHHVYSPRQCAKVCTGVTNCQAFSVAEGRCKMFVFDRCSKNVRECTCNRLTRVFIRKQPGLPPGALCPADFSHNRCGTKYKFVYDTSRWDVGMDRCMAESGLVIMTEPIDAPRLNYLFWLFDNKYKRPGDDPQFFLGGSQDPGSPEPAGGWYWSTCRIPIASGLWQRHRQPDNAFGVEDYACTARPEINDCSIQFPSWAGTFCECVSPFD